MGIRKKFWEYAEKRLGKESLFEWYLEQINFSSGVKNMKLEVYQSREEKEAAAAAEANKPIRLKLTPIGSGFDLEVVDEAGEEICSLIRITPEGVYRHSGINRDIGFELNKNGRLNDIT
jgi:hypothetical protein